MEGFGALERGNRELPDSSNSFGGHRRDHQRKGPPKVATASLQWLEDVASPEGSDGLAKNSNDHYRSIVCLQLYIFWGERFICTPKPSI
jgi:hypothetical protein